MSVRPLKARIRFEKQPGLSVSVRLDAQERFPLRHEMLEFLVDGSRTVTRHPRNVSENKGLGTGRFLCDLGERRRGIVTLTRSGNSHCPANTARTARPAAPESTDLDLLAVTRKDGDLRLNCACAVPGIHLSEDGVAQTHSETSCKNLPSQAPLQTGQPGGLRSGP